MEKWLQTPPALPAGAASAMPTTGERWFAVTVKAENGREKGACPWEGSGCARPPVGNAVRVWPSREGCLVVGGDAREFLVGLPTAVPHRLGCQVLPHHRGMLQVSRRKLLD